MKNLKIGKKFLVTFGIITALLCLTAIFSIISLQGNGSKFTSFYDTGYKITNQSLEMRRLIQSAAKNVGYSTMTMDLTQTGNYIDTAEQNLTELNNSIAFLRSNFRGNQSLVDQLESTINSSNTSKEQVFALARQNKSEEAADIFFNQYNPFLLTATDLLTQINQEAEHNADSDYASSQKAVGQSISFLVILSIAALIITVVMALYITRQLTSPILEIEAVAKKMAEGSLDVNIEYQSKDELGSLAGSMRVMTQGIAKIVLDISYVLKELASGNFTVKTKAEENYLGDYEPILSSMRHIRVSLSDTLSQINQAADQVAGGSNQVS